MSVIKENNKNELLKLTHRNYLNLPYNKVVEKLEDTVSYLRGQPAKTNTLVWINVVGYVCG